uniref:Fork-head domain-containing protein n=1 Tax=Glossina austeni TaxID=7395 RepID=A0A1A9VBQ5_GLOAU
MIDNVPVYSGANNTTSSSQQGSQEYGNFLKRKNLESENITGDRINSEKNNNNNNDSFQQQEDLSDSQHNWKKRHLDNGATTLTTYEHQTIFYAQNISETKKSANLTSAEAGEGAIRLGDSDGDGDSYNIMTNSSFINDFLTYDANLLVPVTRNGSLAESLISSEESIFTTSPSTICVNTTAQFEDTADHWQASDLLELDHRYNSSLQTEITQLNPTLSLKSAELPLNNLSNDSKAREATTFASQVNSNNNNFLIPARPEHQHNRLTSTSVAKNRTNLMASHRDNETDFEDKNLLWLLNFKFDEFPHLSPDVAGKTGNRNFHVNAVTTNNVYNSSSYAGNSSTSSSSSIPLAASSSSSSSSSSSASSSSSSSSSSLASSSLLLPNNKTHTTFGISNRERSRSPKSSIKASKKFEELVMEVTSEIDGNDMTISENAIIDDSSIRSAKKPPFTYTELIEYALEDKGELTVSGIYQWISLTWDTFARNRAV